jgi:signal transduction histidine kinase
MELFKSIFDFNEDYRAEKLINILDIFHEMVLIVSADHRILYANSESRKKMNLIDYHQNKIELIIHLEKEFSDKIFKVNQPDIFHSFESYLLNFPDVPVNCDVSLFNLTNGSDISFWIIQDISEYKRIENSLELTGHKYRNILQETGDAVLILNNDFYIKEINQSGLTLLGLDKSNETEVRFNQFLNDETIEKLNSVRLGKGKLVNHRMKLMKNGKESDAMILLNFRNIPGCDEYIVFMKDVSDELQFHQLMLRTIVNTQEKERERFARDIHDDLGQQLSALKFNLSALRSYISNEQARELLVESENILMEASTSVRSICFDLMPKSLEKNGLIETIRELIRKMEAMDHVEIELNFEDCFPKLSDEMNVSIYRIIQEFMHNSIRHGHSSNIRILLKKVDNIVLLHLSDNGRGFDMEDKNRKFGNGMDNIDSRAKAYNGMATFRSKPGMGTSCDVRMSIINE